MQAPSAQLWTLATLLAISFASPALAQLPAPAPLPPIPSAYAAEPLVILRSDTVVSMAADGTGWRRYTFAARLNSDEAVKQYSVLTIPYASSSQHVELNYARVLHADGSVTDTPAADAMDMPAPVTQIAPLYSDIKELQLPIRGLRTGDTVEFQFRVVRTKAEAPGQFWGRHSLGETGVILSETFELRLPAGLYVQVWSPTLKPSESDAPASAPVPEGVATSAQHIYKWTTSQLDPTVGKQAEAEAAAKKKLLWTPAQELDAERGKLPTIAWTTFHSWAQVGAWYHALEADRIVPDDTVKAKAAELTAGKTTEDAKAHALYDYVATQIRYIGVDFGIGRYQPHTAAEVLANQYGDCKDKQTLLAALFSAAGIRSDAVLIGAGVRFNQAVPSPASFNHVITRAIVDGKPVWLDSTAEVAPWSMLVLATRDKPALVIPTAPTEAAQIMRTPADPPFPDSSTLVATGSLDASGVSTSHIVITFRGDGALAARMAFRLIPPDKYDQTVQLISKGIGFPGTTSNPVVSRPTDTTQPFQLSFDYKREKAGDWDHLRTLPQVVPVLFPRVADIDPPVHAIQLGFPHTEVSNSSMKLPGGWTAILPAAIHAVCPYATYDMTYRFENGTLYVDRRVQVLAKKVPVSDWKSYETFVNKVNPGQEHYIQLIPAPGDTAQGQTPGIAGPMGGPASEQRTEQIEDALASSDPIFKTRVAFTLANRNNHLADAETLAKQAVKMEEKTTSQLVSMNDKVGSFNQMQILGDEWAALGWVYYHQRQLQQAETYMRAAWELKPRNANYNVYMGIICDAEMRPDDATTFYRMALSATNSPTIRNAIHTRFAKLGIPIDSPLPTDVALPLPGLALQLTDGSLTVVDILVTRDKPPAVTLFQGDPALEKPLAAAIRSAVTDPFPDSGPEKLLRRARVTCTSGDHPSCTLHFVGSQLAMHQTSDANRDSAWQ